MTRCKRISAILLAAVSACCISCIKTDENVGGNMIPVSHTYRVISPDAIPLQAKMLVADSLSGFSSTRITIGAIRKSGETGLTTRSSCITLVPMLKDMDWGENPQFKQFHFTASRDSVSVADKSQSDILQSVSVYELNEKIDRNKELESFDYKIDENAEHIPSGLRREIRSIMQKSYFVLPDIGSLQDSLTRVAHIREMLVKGNFKLDRDYIEAKSLATVAYIVLTEAVEIAFESVPLDYVDYEHGF